MTNAEKFCKLNDIEWKYSEEITSRSHSYFTTKVTNPTFTDAKSILEVMLKRDDWDYFIQVISGRVTSLSWHYWVLNPDKLLDEAISWCEKGEVK